eukprot:2456299-Pleurochrysis_carterae.AAC.2
MACTSHLKNAPILAGGRTFYAMYSFVESINMIQWQAAVWQAVFDSANAINGKRHSILRHSIFKLVFFQHSNITWTFRLVRVSTENKSRWHHLINYSYAFLQSVLNVVIFSPASTG